MSRDNSEKDWVGYLIKAPHNEDGHGYFVTGRWKQENNKNLWWWQCADCYDSAGVISGEQLAKFEEKGLARPPDDEDYVRICEETNHPKEGDSSRLDHYKIYNWD